MISISAATCEPFVRGQFESEGDTQPRPAIAHSTLSSVGLGGDGHHLDCGPLSQLEFIHLMTHYLLWSEHEEGRAGHKA